MIRYLKFVASIIIIQAIIQTRCQSKSFDYYGDNRGGGGEDDGGGDPRSSSKAGDVEYLANYENFEPYNYMDRKRKPNKDKDYRNFELPNPYPESEPVFEPDFQIKYPQQYNSEKPNSYRKAEEIRALPYPDDIFSKSKTESSKFLVQDYDSYNKFINSEPPTNEPYKRSLDSNSNHISISENTYRGTQNPKFSGEQTDEDKTTANVDQNSETVSDVQDLIETNSANNHNHEEMPVETSTISNKVETTSNDHDADENFAATVDDKLEIFTSTDTETTSEPHPNDYDYYDLTISEKSNIINSELEKVPSNSSPEANVYVGATKSIGTITASTSSPTVELEIDENKIISTLTIKPTQSIGIYNNDEETDKVDGDILTTTTNIPPLSIEQSATTINIPLNKVKDQTSTIGYESNVTSSLSSYEDTSSSTLIDIITKNRNELIEIPISSLREEEIEEQIKIPETTITGLYETTFIPELEEPEEPEPDIANTSIQMDKNKITTADNTNISHTTETDDQSEVYETEMENAENISDDAVGLNLEQNKSTTFIGEQNLKKGNSNGKISIDTSKVKLEQNDQIISTSTLTKEFGINFNLTTILPDEESTTVSDDDIDSIDSYTPDSVLLESLETDKQSFESETDTYEPTKVKTLPSEKIEISEDYDSNNVILNSKASSENESENNFDPKIIEIENGTSSTDISSTTRKNTIDMDMKINASIITTGKTLMGDEKIISTDSVLENGEYLIERNSGLDSPLENSDSSNSNSEKSTTSTTDTQSNGNQAENTEEVELDKNLKSPLNPTTDISSTINADNQSGPDESSTIKVKEMKVDDEEEKLKWERVEIKYSTGIYTKNDTKNESKSQLRQTHTDTDKALSSESDGNDDYSSSENRNNNLTIMTGNDSIELSDQNQNITINLIEGGDTNNNNNSSSSRVNLTSSKMSTFRNNINDSSSRRKGGSSELLNEVKDLTRNSHMNLNETTGTGSESSGRESRQSSADDRDRTKVVTKSSIIFEKIVEINESSLQDQKDKNTQALVLKETRSIDGLKNPSLRNLNETSRNNESQKTSEERFLEEAENEMNDFAKNLVSMDGLLKDKNVQASNKFENKNDTKTLFDNTTKILEPLAITTNLSEKNPAAFYNSNLKISTVALGDNDNDNETSGPEGKYKNESEIKIDLENTTESQIAEINAITEPTYSITEPNETMNSTLEGQGNNNNILSEPTTIEIVNKIYSKVQNDASKPKLVNPTGSTGTTLHTSNLTNAGLEMIEKNLIKDLKSINGEIEPVIPSNDIVTNSNINNSLNAILKDQNESGLEMNSQIGDKNAVIKDKIEIILDKDFSTRKSTNAFDQISSSKDEIFPESTTLTNPDILVVGKKEDFIIEFSTKAVKDQDLLMKSEAKPDSKILDKTNEIIYTFEKDQQTGITIVPESGVNVTPSIYTNQQQDIIPLVPIDSNFSSTFEIEGTKNHIELKPEVEKEMRGVKIAEINTENTTFAYSENFAKQENPSSKVNNSVLPLKSNIIGRGFVGKILQEPISRNNSKDKTIKLEESPLSSFMPSKKNTGIDSKTIHNELRLKPEVNVTPKLLEQINEIPILEVTIEPTTTTSITSILKPEESSNNDTISDDQISSSSTSTTDTSTSSIEDNAKSSIILKDPKWVNLTMVQEKTLSENALEVEGNDLDNYSVFTTKSQNIISESDDVLMILQTTNPATEDESYTISSSEPETLGKEMISSSATSQVEKPVGDELLQVVGSSSNSISSSENPRMGIDINEISFSQKEPDYVENDINKNFDDEDQKIGSKKVPEIIEEKNFPLSTLSSNSKQLDNTTTTTRINVEGTKKRNRNKEKKYDEEKPSYKINNKIIKNRDKGFERIILSGSSISTTKATTTTGKGSQIYTSTSPSSTADSTVSVEPTTVKFENILKNDGSRSFSPNTFSSSSTKKLPLSLSLKKCLDHPIKCQHCHGQPVVHICGNDLRIYQSECEFLCHMKICPVLRRVEFTVCWSKVTHHQIFQEQVSKLKIKKPQPPSPINKKQQHQQRKESALKLERFLSRWHKTIR